MLLLLASYAGYATHLRSGEISYQPVAGYPNTYLITFTIYTNMSPGIVADQNTLPVVFGNGTNATLDLQQAPSTGTPMRSISGGIPIRYFTK